MQREMEERQRMEREEAQMRNFKAQPILKEIVDHGVYTKKEKEMKNKQYREESEAARMIEEEKALKRLRRVPHARPVPKFAHHFCPQKHFDHITPKFPNNACFFFPVQARGYMPRTRLFQ